MADTQRPYREVGIADAFGDEDIGGEIVPMLRSDGSYRLTWYRRMERADAKDAD